jgi:hypothetical protein
MSVTVRSLRVLVAGLSLAAAMPGAAQEPDSQPPPPPPEALPWAPPPTTPPPPPPPRAQQPVYRPDYVVVPPPPRRPVRYPDERYAPPPYRAERAPWYPHAEVSFRAGMAASGGTAADGLSLSDSIGDQVALGVELGLRATPNLYLGFLLEGGVGDGGRAGCAPDCNTSSSTGRLGLQLRYHLAPFAQIDPWLGYGVAVVAAHQHGSDAAGTFSRTFSGVEWAKVSVGADLRLARTTSIGVFAEWTRGTFTHLDDRQDGVLVASGELARTTDHSWFMIGPRLTF